MKNWNHRQIFLRFPDTFAKLTPAGTIFHTCQYISHGVSQHTSRFQHLTLLYDYEIQNIETESRRFYRRQDMQKHNSNLWLKEVQELKEKRRIFSCSEEPVVVCLLFMGMPTSEARPPNHYGRALPDTSQLINSPV